MASSSLYRSQSVLVLTLNGFGMRPSRIISSNSVTPTPTYQAARARLRQRGVMDAGQPCWAVPPSISCSVAAASVMPRGGMSKRRRGLGIVSRCTVFCLVKHCVRGIGNVSGDGPQLCLGEVQPKHRDGPCDVEAALRELRGVRDRSQRGE
jgi:hypothetical protein